MPVYPLTFHIGPIEITGFGIMVMLGFFIAGYAIQIRLRELGLNEQYAWDMVVAAVIGGLVGAKIWYVFLYQDVGKLFDRGGLVWYGGLIGGAVAVILNGWRLKVPLRLTTDLAAPALAAGQGLGRVGCFLVQDDYGIPTSLPWGLKFPNGMPPSTAQNLSAWGVEIPSGTEPYEVLAVHPTQIYETALLLFAFWLLWRWRGHSRGTGWLFSIYLILTGTERFFIEFIRAKDDRFLGSLTLAQGVSFGIVALGVVLAMQLAKSEKFSAEKVKALKPDGTTGSRGSES